jgi:putative OPT family oligopeptide transporter
MKKSVSYISAEEKVPELTLRVILLAMILTVLLATSNAYLALKLGLLTSASIPAAIISMGILRFFKNSTILENNAVQTAASAGEAVAGGIVYTIPALIIIQYWYHFDYLSNFCIAALGGILGVLFSIPLRQILVHDQALKFPEGWAIAEVLKSSSEKIGVGYIFAGGMVGAGLELLQNGFKLIASNFSFWFVAGKSVFGFGTGFSATMIGAGFLIGYEMAISIFLGAIISWVIALPLVSAYFSDLVIQHSPQEAASLLWNNKMRYLGIGAMLFAGIWTFLNLVKPLSKSISNSFFSNFREKKGKQLPRTERDISFPIILISVGLILVLLFLFFQQIFPLDTLGIKDTLQHSLIFSSVLYILIIGFLFSVMTAYFSGMVGVTASPGSSVIIAGMLFAAWLLLTLCNKVLPFPLSNDQIKAAEAITIIIGSIVTGIAAIANDNTQDLKVGQLVGATPWKQQLMLLLGVVVSSLVIPPVMQVLFNVYGIAGVMPHDGMDMTKTLPAPNAALMAAITEAVFRNTLPWLMMLIGGCITLVFLLINYLLKSYSKLHISILGVAIGMYLPLSTSLPLFVGGLIAIIVKRGLHKRSANEEKKQSRQNGVLIACGLVAGSALMDVFLAIPFSIGRSPDVLQLVGPGWENYGVILGVISTCLLGFWMYRSVCGKASS